MATQREIRRRIALDVEQAIREWARGAWTPAQIHDKIASLKKFEGKVPSLRTVERIVAEERRPIPAGGVDTWTVEGLRMEAALDALATAIEKTDGRVEALTASEAEWVGRLALGAPELPPFTAYLLARRYIARIEAGESTEDLDTVLAFKVWQGAATQEQYRRAVDAGWIVNAPSFILKSLDPDPDSEGGWWYALFPMERGDAREHHRHRLEQKERKMRRLEKEWEEAQA